MDTGVVPGNATTAPENAGRAGALPIDGALVGYIAVLALGLVIRVMTLGQYTVHIDEPASLLAITRVSEIGYPLFPSGVLYLQGAVFSYLAAPLAWFLDDTALLDASRILYMCIALSVIPLTMKLAQDLTGSLAVAAFVGVLVACDPNLVIWGVLVRPYGILAAETVALLLTVTMLYRHGADAHFTGLRVVWWIPVLATLGTFTHVGFWLVVPPLVLGAVVVWKRSLFGANRAILLSGVVSLVPLLVFLLLGRFVGTGSGTADGAIGGSFVGSHVFTLRYLRDVTDVRWAFWTSNFFTGAFHTVMPYLITLASGLLAFAVVAAPFGERDHWRAATAGTLLVTHWLIICTVVLFVFDYPGEPYPHRYLNQVLPLGYLLTGVAAWSLWRIASRRNRLTRWLVSIGIVVVIAMPALANVTTAAAWRMEFPGGSADYWEASAWTADHIEPDQLVLTAMPPAAYFWFSSKQLEDTRFLAGPAGSLRPNLYIKPNMSGQPGDYWLGVPSIGSTEQLCTTLVEHAGGAWIIVDAGRLTLPWGFQGRMQAVITGSTEERYRGHRGIMALFVKPVDGWTAEARAECGL